MAAGADIARRFFHQAVRGIVEAAAPGVGYVAGRLGTGSDVLGFDDHTSTDHDFGCRLTVLVDDEYASWISMVDTALTDRLPDDVDGWPVRFAFSGDEQVVHRVDIHTVTDFMVARLGFDPRSLDVAQWLCLTGQSVLEATAGPVFHDSTRTFAEIRHTLAWYPDAVWLYVVAAGWARLAQELPFVGRTGQVGDDAGSRIIASRLCRDIAHLTFLAQRAWPPYPKWMGAALRSLPDGEPCSEQLAAVQAATTLNDRQRRLAIAIEALADRQRRAGITLPAEVMAPFYDRPFVAIHDDVTPTLRAQITDPAVRDLPPIGSIEQWCDNVDLLSKPARRANLAGIYGVV
ncbi:MAG: DUF4037 domain-containing protein [Actinomycetota bacterium]